MPKRLGPLQKFRMKAGFSFALLRDRQPPAGGLALFCLGAWSFSKCHFSLTWALAKAHGVYNFLCLLYLKAPGKMCVFRPKTVCLQAPLSFGYGVYKMTETVLFPSSNRPACKAAVRIFPLLRRFAAPFAITACMSAGLLVRYIRLVILIHGANVCLVQVFVFPSMFTEENFANDKEPGQRLLRKDRGGQFLLPKDHQGDGLYEI